MTTPATRSWRRLFQPLAAAITALRHPRFFTVLFSGIVGGLVVVLLKAAPDLGFSKAPYVVIDAETQLLRFRVTRPAIARIELNNARTTATIENCTLPEGGISGLLEPGDSSLVTYRVEARGYVIETMRAPENAIRRVPVGQLSPTIDSILRLPDDSECKLPERAAFAVRWPAQDSPDAPIDLDLPIAGPAEVGAEMRARTMGPDGPTPMSGLLRKGTVSVFGRTSGWPFPSILYTVSDSVMNIPAGARLASGNIDVVPEQLPPSWYGLARVDPENKLLMVSASTVSSELQLFRPGAAGDAERLGLGLITRLVNDPVLALLVIGLAVFSFIFQIVTSLLQLERK